MSSIRAIRRVDCEQQAAAPRRPTWWALSTTSALPSAVCLDPKRVFPTTTCSATRRAAVRTPAILVWPGC